MPTTEEDLDTRRQAVQDLREQIAETRAARERAQSEVVNDVTAAELDAEKAKLELELAREKTMADKSNVTAAVDVMLEAAKLQRQQAEAAAKQEAGTSPEAKKAAKEAADAAAGKPVPVRTTGDEEHTTPAKKEK